MPRPLYTPLAGLLNLEVAPSGAVIGFLLKTLVVFLGGASSAMAGFLEVDRRGAVFGLADLSEGEVEVLLGPLEVLMIVVLHEPAGFFKRTTFVPGTFLTDVVAAAFGLHFKAELDGAMALLKVNVLLEVVEIGFVSATAVSFLVTGFL